MLVLQHGIELQPLTNWVTIILLNHRDTGHCHIYPSKEKACPHAFRARKSHWPPNVTVGRINDTIPKILCLNRESNPGLSLTGASIIPLDYQGHTEDGAYDCSCQSSFFCENSRSCPY